MQFETISMKEIIFWLYVRLCVELYAQMCYAKNTTEIDELAIINVGNNVKINALHLRCCEMKSNIKELPKIAI